MSGVTSPCASTEPLLDRPVSAQEWPVSDLKRSRPFLVSNALDSVSEHVAGMGEVSLAEGEDLGWNYFKHVG